jgi:hypothetical protein
MFVCINKKNKYEFVIFIHWRQVRIKILIQIYFIVFYLIT